MNKSIWQILGILILLISACTPSVANPTIITNQSATATSSPLPTTPQTSLPSTTPTASITPLPTIPTFTPTFDVSTIVTVTHAPQAECPKENASLKLTFSFSDPTIKPEKEILKFLNNGGSVKTILSALPSYYYPDSVRYQDLTGDGIPELAYLYYSGNAIFYIFTCAQGKYTLYQSEFSSWIVDFLGVFDMNLNRLPKLVVRTRSCTGGGCYRYHVLEWNGTTYINLAPEVYVDDVLDETITETNNDGVLELIVTAFPVPNFTSPPWRKETHTFIWNGTSFAAQQVEYAQPNYRFQAVQDGDLEISLGKYDSGLNLYKQAIFHNILEWWSSERQKYEEDKLGWYAPTPSAKPSEDKTEYPRLAAYAYYRIMLLNLAQEHESDATTAYDTLQQKSGNDPYGRPYVEMATAFWDAYQSTHKMYDGCAAAIQYVVEHPEILIPLGSDYHGSQSKIYRPEDVCPFR